MDADLQPRLAGLAFDKRCSPQRALADSWTKILFQYNARSGGVQIQHILEVRASLGVRLGRRVPGDRLTCDACGACGCR